MASEVDGLEWLKVDRRPLDWNGPTRRIFSRFREEDLDRPIIDHFERLARRCPDLVAVTDAESSLTFGELWDGLSGLAQTIVAETRPGDLVGILMPSCPMFPLAMLACLAAGRPFVPLDPHYPDEWLAQVLDDAKPVLIIGRGDLPDASGARVCRLDQLPKPAKDGWRPVVPGQDEPACVLFTSGSTGRPKGIVNSQRALLQRVAQSVNAGHIGADDRFLTLASLCTIVGVRDALTSLLSGATLHLLDPQLTGAREVLDVVRTEAITILFGFPALLRSIVGSSAERAGADLRLVRLGGDTALWSDVDLLRAWLAPRAAIQLIFAATEAPMMQWFVEDSRRAEDERLPIGYPLAGNQLGVMDEAGRSVRPGDVGELVVGGPHVRLGHWVGGRLVPTEVETLGGQIGRLFRTGDLVRQRPDGLLERLGRKDRQVKIRGARVELDGVEAALRQHPQVRDVGALARPGDDDGELTLVAYVCAQDRAPEGLLDDLREMMRSAPPAMRPARFYLVPEIPRLPSSKLDVRALMALDAQQVQREQASAVAASKVRPANTDRISRAVARVWREVLNSPPGGPEEDFFDAGGDSLRAVTFMLELERALDLELSLTLINEAPTFAAICEALREHRTGRYVPLVLLKAGQGPPPVFFVHGAGGNVVDLFPIARAMTYPGPVIGIQARGLVRQDAPHPTVEAMASEYLRAIKARQPAGPYHLCGYSFGGLVAFEMARRLHEAGDEVDLVGLFDTTTSQMGWRPQSWPALVRRGWSALWGRQRQIPPPGPALPGALGAAPARVVKVAASALVAAARYRPGFYPGELKLFTPTVRDPALPSPAAIWAKHAGALSIVHIAGGHFTMLSAPHVVSAAEALTSCLPVSRPDL